MDVLGVWIYFLQDISSFKFSAFLHDKHHDSLKSSIGIICITKSSVNPESMIVILLSRHLRPATPAGDLLDWSCES